MNKLRPRKATRVRKITAKSPSKKTQKKASKKIDTKLVPSSNIGMVGHVAHGKTTLTEALTGKLTLAHSEELKRGITIRLGYADARIYKCPKCGKYSVSEKCQACFEDGELQRTVSLIDAPGHETLMATVLTGTSLMDGAILIIAANEKCPQPQTREHLTALEVAGIKNVIIVQNKIDLVDEEEAMKNYDEIKGFIRDTIIENAPIVPISAQKNINVDKLLEFIQDIIPDHAADVEGDDPKLLMARSFDINKPGTRPKKLKGGVLGGSIIQGKLKVGDEIEIRPGYRKDSGSYSPLKTKVLGLQKAGLDLEEAGPGGLLGVMTGLDPSLTKSDILVGNIAGHPGKLSDAVNEIDIEVSLLERVVGLEEMENVKPIRPGENLMISIGTARSVGSVEKIGKSVRLILKLPVCVEKRERVVISRQVSGRWRLIGYGIVA